MATALNVFKTFTYEVTETLQDVYETPLGVTAIVLMAQVANISSSPVDVTVAHTAGLSATELIKDFTVAGNDAVSAVTGKLVIESGNKVQASATEAGSLKITLSILETLNA